MNLQAKVGKKLNSPSGVYCHIPFCGSTCDFCAFYQEKPHRKDLDRYLAGMEKEIELFLPAGPIQTVFWGGGTPGLLPAVDLKRLGDAMLNRIGERPREWTVEMAPATVKMDKLLALKELGVTRLSMGVQTFNEGLLKSLGRLHAPHQVYKAYELMRSAGFDNISLDLIFSIPGQTEEALKADLDEVIRLAPEHVSAYCLTFEEDTALYVKLSEGKISRDADLEAHLYQFAWEHLEKHGYKQYEVSNFSKPGYECQHNLDTWAMKTWIGFGPSASSQYDNRRYTNPYSIDEWLSGLESGVMPFVDESKLDEATLGLDSLIFGLRMNKGVDLSELEKRFPSAPWISFKSLINKLTAEGLSEFSNNIFRLTLAGRLMADRIGAEFLDCTDE